LAAGVGVNRYAGTKHKLGLGLLSSREGLPASQAGEIMRLIGKSPYIGTAEAASPSRGPSTSAQKTKYRTNASVGYAAVIVDATGIETASPQVDVNLTDSSVAGTTDVNGADAPAGTEQAAAASHRQGGDLRNPDDRRVVAGHGLHAAEKRVAR
jgi:hypothetical protein